jgi:hypothetical protein
MAGRPAPWGVKHREIKEGDSKVLVTDTGTGQVDMIVDGSTVQSWTVSGGAGFPTGSLSLGVDDTTAGVLTIYGSDGATGGRVRLYAGETDDDYDDFFDLEVDGGYLKLKDDGGFSILSYRSSTGQLELDATLLYLDVPVDFASSQTNFQAGFQIGGAAYTGTAAELNYNDLGVAPGTAAVSKSVVLDATLSHTGIRNLTLGQDNFAAGTLRLYASDEDSGGRIYFHNALDATGTSTYWKLQSYEADSGNSKMTFGHTSKEILNIWDSNNTIYLQSACTLDCESGTFNVSSANNKINGVNVTAQAAELNYNDLTTGPGTAEANKAVVLDGSKNIATIGNITANRMITPSSTYMSGAVENTGGFTVTVNGNENAIIAAANGSVSLYYDDTIKAATYADGLSITNGTILIDGTAKQLVSNTSFNVLVGSTENAIVCTQDGSVALYYDGSQRFVTSNAGCYIYGANGFMDIQNNATSSLVNFRNTAGFTLSVDNDVAIKAYENLNVDLYYAGTVEMSTQANGIALPNGALTTSTGTPIDLTLNCGSQKTLVLSQPVWDDIVVSTASVRLGGASPATEQAYKGGLVASFSSASDNYLYFTLELPHTYKEGTDVLIHFHYVLPVAGAGGGAGTEQIKFDLSFCPSENGGAFGTPDTSGTTGAIDVNAMAADDLQINSIHTISGTNLKVSDTIICSIKRDVSVANDYANAIYVIEVDAHYQVDTMGSRQEFIK